MFPVSKAVYDETMKSLNIANITTATIRQIVALSNRLEEPMNEKFVHLEMGNPGLPPCEVGAQAEAEALAKGVAAIYPNIAGIPELKQAGSDFLRAYLDIDMPPRCIIPTVGSMQGTFTTFLLLGQRQPGRDTFLMLSPGFPAQQNQAKLLGYKTESLDIYDCRGEALEARLEKILSKGTITAILYNNPNNPAWTNLTDVEYRILARMAEKYDVIIMEDLAYLGMDFRKDYGIPYEAPFVPTIAKYTDRYILFVSASKIFSYAGQRIALVCMSPTVADRRYDFYEKFYEIPKLIDAYVFGVLYCASSGVAHSPQYALAAMMRAAVEGRVNFVEDCREYGRRAGIAKRMFTENGFHIVYALDGDKPISDGFFFTVGYGKMTSAQLQSELMRYGISAISLPSTGSAQHGLRICVSMLSSEETFENLEKRLKAFNAEFSNK